MQIQENSNTSQLHQEIQQDGTNALTGTTGTQEVQTVPKIPSYSQGVLDFQGIAIGIKTLCWSVVIALIFLTWGFGNLWFAIKHDDPSLLAPLPFGLIQGSDVQAPLDPMLGIDSKASLDPTEQQVIEKELNH